MSRDKGTKGGNPSRDSALTGIGLLSSSVSKHVEMWRLHQERCFALLSEVVTTGKYPPERCLADALTLTLECCALVHECCHPSPGSKPDPTPPPDLGFEFDQRSEMVGPIRFTLLDEPDPAPPRKIPGAVVSTTIGVSDRTFVRILANGEAWLCLVNVGEIAPTLPEGTYSVDVADAKVDWLRISRPDEALLFGSGVVPAELIVDAELGLAELIPA